jgi:spermidine synthase
MRSVSTLLKANVIVFISSFCVMVVELVAARVLAPYIGVSLYTWTTIIGVILAGIALGNYLGGKIADKSPSSRVLTVIFLMGSLLTVSILPLTKLVGTATCFDKLPIMLNFIARTFCIFFIPATVLSMVSPLVIKLTLTHLEHTGGIVGTIYAVSTVGSIFGTFMTGFYFILWFGTRTIIWLAAVALLITAVVVWFSWKITNRWKPSLKNVIVWIVILFVVLSLTISFQYKSYWQESYTAESNYYTIKVRDDPNNVKVLILDHLVHSYVIPDNPIYLKYDYMKIFAEFADYLCQENPAPKVLHLGGGGYSLPRYFETIYPASSNEVVEIDPTVTEIAHTKLGLPRETSIITYNQDARLFLINRNSPDKFDIIVGDVFNDFSTPYHLTTLEFDRLVKANLTPNGVYLVNIIDNYMYGRYLPSFVLTLKQTYKHVYLLVEEGEAWKQASRTTFVIAATDQTINLNDYRSFVTEGGRKQATGIPLTDEELNKFLADKKPILFSDDHVPTDILVALLYRYE